MNIEKLDAMIQAIFDQPRTEPEVYIPEGWGGLLQIKHEHLPDYAKARASGSKITLLYDDYLLAHKLTLIHPDMTPEDVSHWLYTPRPWSVKRAELEHIAAKYVKP